MPELTIAERVANGVAWLDKNARGWDVQIDLQDLDIEEPCNCVLGQVYGHYFKSPRSARIDEAPDGDANYYLSCDRGFNGDDYDMAALTAEWRRVIEARRAGEQS